jgi:hypothetical protein
LVATNFLDKNGIYLDTYLIQVLHGICTQFKNISEFMKHHPQIYTETSDSENQY